MNARERLDVDVGLIRYVINLAGDSRDFSTPEVRQVLRAKDTKTAVDQFDQLVRGAYALQRRIAIEGGAIDREATHGGWG